MTTRLVYSVQDVTTVELANS